MRYVVGLGLASCVGVFVACSSDPAPTPGLKLSSGSSSSSSGTGGHASSTSSSSSGGGGKGTGGSAAGGGGAGGSSSSSSGSGSSSSSGGGGGGAGPGLSCMGGLDCGGVSCCDNVGLPGGAFPMGRSVGGTDAYVAGGGEELPEHAVTVAPFTLDTFEVTVGRFRKFAAAFDGTPPAAGAGAHPLIPNSGWQASWNGSLAASQAALIANLGCDAASQTWTDAAGADESMPMNCVTWFEAAAFCAWDGGRLPTEAEWEYAAAGSDNRLYPWGSDNPSVNKALADHSGSDASPFLAVGTHPAGKGKWGHQDLGGGMFEWVLDWYDGAWYGGGGASCVNCADINGNSYRVLRGGSWLTGTAMLRAAARMDDTPSNRSQNSGFRCARGK